MASNDDDAMRLRSHLREKYGVEMKTTNGGKVIGKLHGLFVLTLNMIQLSGERVLLILSEEDEHLINALSEEDEHLMKAQLEEDEQLAKALQESMSVESPPRYDNRNIFEPFPFFFLAGYKYM
ncbi:Protein DA1-related 1 [Morella rubra]|uniref:Protein DA1-related 1 n=1 Tax=Morella rubra TaxID=262757 RepID=A0A6A1WEE2_9ROSI|nr:Protein DA1-related 1 [Morella rubra]